MAVRIIHGDCLVELPKMTAAGERFHACVCDPPYHLTSMVSRLSQTSSADVEKNFTKTIAGQRTNPHAAMARGFMGKAWDGGDIALRPETWRAVFDCLLPGAYLLAFGGTRTSHRMACAIEDAGFEIRDTICWLYGSGFPKSLDVSKAIDRAAGAVREVVGVNAAAVRNKQRNTTWTGDVWGDNGASITAPATPEAAQWSGWGTALKPAHEPIIVARKPLDGTVAGNVLRHGCGALNIDASRIAAATGDEPFMWSSPRGGIWSTDPQAQAQAQAQAHGRWPANVIHDGSDEVLAAFAEFGDRSSTRANGNPNDPIHGSNGSGSSYEWGNVGRKSVDHRDTGSAARFFYTAKADASDRAGSKHPTVKPTDLMRYLVRLVTPPGGTVLDPFAGTGSTGLAADQLGFNAVLIEQDATYAEDARRKFVADAGMFAEIILPPSQ